jgi:hypothetical protein
MHSSHLSLFCHLFLKTAQHWHNDAAQNADKSRRINWALENLYEDNNLKAPFMHEELVHWEPQDIAPEVGYRASHHADNEPAPEIPLLSNPYHEARMQHIHELLKELEEELALSQ